MKIYEKKIKWGIVSTARIALEKVIPAIRSGNYGLVSAIASRSVQNAGKVADRLRIPKAYDAYDKLLQDPDIDAVYIALPNHMHVHWSIRALEAGKHVLCEKPIALHAAEARNLLDVAGRFPQLKIMEAFVYRHHPQWRHVGELISDGVIGEMRAVQIFYAYTNTDPGNIRNIAEYGGGALLDIGCYCISLSRHLFKAEPLKITGYTETDPRFRVDRLAAGTLIFAKGISSFICSTQLAFFQNVDILGTDGRIAVPAPFITPLDTPTHMTLHQKSGSKEIGFAPCNQYMLECDAFAKAIIENTELPSPLTDAVANMQALDALAESARSGCGRRPAS